MAKKKNRASNEEPASVVADEPTEGPIAETVELDGPITSDGPSVEVVELAEYVDRVEEGVDVTIDAADTIAPPDPAHHTIHTAAQPYPHRNSPTLAVTRLLARTDTRR